MTELSVETRHSGGVTLLYPRGFINAHTVREFELAFANALDRQETCIVVNCSGLRYIASAGLGAIMGVIEDVREAGGDIRLAELNETVANILEILGFDRLYKIFPTELEAVSSFLSEASRS
jgi:anti-sigma B factor antagonist